MAFIFNCHTMAKQFYNGLRKFLQQVFNFPIDYSHSHTCCFLIFALNLQLILFGAINEIFPSTTVFSNIPHHYRSNLSEPPAKRLVVIVSDGLRSQSLFAQDMASTPYLKTIVLNKGAWGISHTAVPTESRSGHAALLAGIIEDVSSVTSLWTEQVLHVDHIFNRSRETFAWGSSSLWVTFSTDDERLHAVSHDHHRDNYIGNSAVEILDEVLKKIMLFLETKEPHVMRRQNGLLFFVHLLSTDLGGHSLKPYSKAYKRLMGRIDSTVAKVEAAFERFFNDGRTAFLFTADHGMTDWGSHGGGDITETSTPFIAWGSGLSGPRLKSQNLSQIDLCPLMASLLDIEIPSNNHGLLPLSLLNVSAVDSVGLMRANALQLLELFKIQWRHRKRISPANSFSSFPKLSPKSAEHRLQEANHKLTQGNTTVAAEMLNQLALDAQEGLKYFRHYDRSIHVTFISATFFLWILCLVLSLLPKPRTELTPPESLEVGFFLIILAGQCFLLFYQRRTAQQCLIHLLPLFLFWSVHRHWRRLLSISISRRNVNHLLFIALGLELLVCCFNIRSTISVAIILNVAWQLSATYGKSTSISIVYMISSCVIIVFPLLPVIDGSSNLALVPIGPLITGGILVVLLATHKFRERLSWFQFLALVIALIVLCLASITHQIAHYEIQRNERLPDVVQVTNWILLIVALTISLLVCCYSSIMVSSLSIVVSITTIYLLFSLAYESIFLFCLFIVLQSWAALEIDNFEFSSPFLSLFLLQPKHRNDSADVKQDGYRLSRISLAFLILIMVSLLGPGNIASMNSYDPKSIFTFFTVCRFIITIPLSFFKIFLPMILTTCFFSVLSTSYPIVDIVKMALILSNWVAVNHFLLCPYEGDWNTIGNRISYYLICIILSVLLTCFLISTRILLRRSVRISTDMAHYKSVSAQSSAD